MKTQREKAKENLLAFDEFDAQFDKDLEVAKTAIESLHLEPLETDNKQVASYKRAKAKRLVRAKEQFFKALNGTLRKPKAE